MNTHGPIEPDKDHIRLEPYSLPQGFTWDALDLGDRAVVSKSTRPFSSHARSSYKEQIAHLGHLL